MPDFSPLTALIMIIVLSIGVWQVGSRLTYLSDAIASQFGISRSVIGLLLLSTSTSLPEIVTTVSAAAAALPLLALNNLFGGIALQTAILAAADYWAKGAITNYPRKANHALEAVFIIFLLSMVQTVLLLSQSGSMISFWGRIGIGSLIVGVAYVVIIYLLRRYDGQNDWVPVDIPDDMVGVMNLPDSYLMKLKQLHLILLTFAATLIILILGFGLVYFCQVFITTSGISAGFVGVTLLATATSLPELATTITAVRHGAYTLAISNVFGSNLIMIGLVLPADLVFSKGPIFAAADASTHLAIVTGLLVTTVYIVGLLIRRKPKLGPLGIDSLIVLFLFFGSLILQGALS